MRSEFVADVRRAVENRMPYAAGKIGISEKQWMYYPIFLGKESDPRKIVAYEASLRFHALKQSGLFPADTCFYHDFTRDYVDYVRELDCLGVFNDSPVIEPEIIHSYQLTSKLTHFRNQEPDRSSPDNPASCYLPAFQDKRILIVCPFAELLRSRATRETFEAVWAKTGKRWFHPSAVEAIEFPYGFSQETQNQYATSLDLLEAIKAEISSHDFDVALIAAGGLGIPLAAFVKSIGKVGLSLGGHLQVLFGVLGARWKSSPEWQERYINAAWIDMPAKYRPNAGDTFENYW